MKEIIFILCFVFCVFSSSSSYSGLYKCKNSNGELEFSDLPCSVSAHQTTLEKEFDARGFRSKFFRNPGNSKSIICSNYNCKCGSYIYELNKDPLDQVINSAYILSSAWNNLEKSNKKKYDEQAYRCKIKIHQKIFNRLYPVVLKSQVANIRMGDFLEKNINLECGLEPKRPSKHGFISDRQYINWHQCNERQKDKQITRNAWKRKKIFRRMNRALEKLR